jgi:ribosomal protein S12 methylthiotransferase
VLEAVHRAAPPQHDPYTDLIPPEGIKAHAAALRLSKDFRRLQQSLHVLHHPKLRGDLVSRPAADVLREAERLVAAGVKELLVISQDTSAYGVDMKYAPSHGRAARSGRNSRSRPRARRVRRLGAAALRLSLPARRRCDPADGGRQSAALSRRAVPARQSRGAQTHAPAGRPGKNALAHPAWREICPSLTIRSTFIVGFPGETEEDFSLLLDWLGEAELDRVGCFRYEPVAGAAANDLGAPVPMRSRRSAGTA